jgi:uncharacterized protein YbaP (TraB family)
MIYSFIRKRRLQRIALIATLCLVANAAPAADHSGGGKHFLWRVTNAGAPFYLLGSFHALRGTDYPLGPEIDQAIAQSKRFLFEYDVKHTEPEVWEKKLKDAATYPRGVTLKQKVRPETYAYVQKIAKVRATAYDEVKPWAIAMFMFGHPAFYSVRSYRGVEFYVQQKAPSFADVSGLETLDEHLHVLSDMADIEGEVFLLQAMVYGDSAVKQFSDGVAAWKAGDTQRLPQIYAQQEREAPFLAWRLIDHRNAKWIPRIEQEMKSGKPTMIVVGARHLCGPHSVIAMLQARGYKLEQL